MIKIRCIVLLFLLLFVNYCVYAADSTTTCITRKEEINKELTQFSFEEICTLFVNRKGDQPDAHMVAKGLNGVIKDESSYQLTLDGFKPTEDHGEMVTETYSDHPPEYIEVEGYWDIGRIEEGANANILGKNGSFILQSGSDELHVPVVTATSDSLAYYNAVLLTVGDQVKFSLSENFPITVMDVGGEYVDNYLMKEGGGFYIEHHNQPHFHMPMDEDARGFYLLGKKVGGNRYHFTAFKIPYKTGVFTNKDVIHCDAGLVGNYLVGYTIAKEYSTVLLRSSDGEKVKVVCE